jgi:hypothetical protein
MQDRTFVGHSCMLTAITDTEYEYLERWSQLPVELHRRALMVISRGLHLPSYRASDPRWIDPWVASQVIRNREAADPGPLLP